MSQEKGSAIGRLKSTCKFPLCKNARYSNIVSKTYKNKKFFRFPTSLEVVKIWKKICKIDAHTNTKNFYMCEDHFQSSDLLPSGQLKYSTIPSLPDFLQDKEHNLPSASATSAHSSNSSSNVVKYIKISPATTIIKKNSQSLPARPTERFAFLRELNTVDLNKPSPQDISSEQQSMYKVHQNVTAKLSKLKFELRHAKDIFKCIKNLYWNKRFEIIEEDLNTITDDFMHSLLRNIKIKPHDLNRNMQDKAFALSIYKRSPRLYRYLTYYFALPSIEMLQHILSNIPFTTGWNPLLAEHLKPRVNQMETLDRYCSLIFGEMSLSYGFTYVKNVENIFGFEDLGSLGTSSKPANRALVFMIRGIRKHFKEVVAYYFTKDVISADSLKTLILEIIENVQKIGLHVVATVCDQKPNYKEALSLLCLSNTKGSSPNHFVLNGESIYTIFDVPNLLKDTRNAFVQNNVELDTKKIAKFEYIKSAFAIDKLRQFKEMPNVKPEFFNFNDGFSKENVNVAARLLSQSVCRAIESFIGWGKLPAESIDTAYFVSIIDKLFDSLNGSNLFPDTNKTYRCPLSKDSTHIEFWLDILPKITQWQLLDKSDKISDNSDNFLNGWQITITSVIAIWEILRAKGLCQFSLRSLNLDPIQNLFCQIRSQHNLSNNPTSYEFVDGLKIVLLNKYAVPFAKERYCEDDYCESLGDLCIFMNRYLKKNLAEEDKNDSQESEVDPLL